MRDARQRRSGAAHLGDGGVEDDAGGAAHARHEHARADARLRIGQHVQPPDGVAQPETPRELSHAVMPRPACPERVQWHYTFAILFFS